MELAILVWVISMLESITLLLMILGIGLVLLSVMSALTSSDYDSNYRSENVEEKAKSWWRTAKVSAVCAILVFGLTAIIPSEKTAWMMTGAYAAQTVVQSDASKKVLKIIETKLDGVLDETLANAQKKVNKEIDKLGEKKENN